MSEEFCLSDKRHGTQILFENKPIIMYREEDVKEFIRRLKEELHNFDSYYKKVKSQNVSFVDHLDSEIDKLAGEKIC